MSQRLGAWVVAISGTVGGVIALVAPTGSSVQTAGTLLLLASLSIGSLILFYFAKKRAALLAEPPSFPPDMPFQAHLAATVRVLPGSAITVSSLEGKRLYLLVGTEGHSARFRALTSESSESMEIQLLRPEQALAHFSVGMALRVFDGKNIVAGGEVSEVLGKVA